MWQQVADTLSAVPPSGPISATGTVLIGVGASLLTGLVTKVAKGADEKFGRLDSGIRSKIGPALPAVMVGLSVALPLLGNAIGLSDVPSADVVANSPTSAIVGVALREVLRKWVLPLAGR